MSAERQQMLSRLREATKNVRKSTTILLWVFSLAAIGLFVASFIVPPTGVIDPSVLKGVAWLFAFAALLEAREAIMEGLGVKLTHGDTTLQVGDMDGKDPEPAAGPDEDADPDIEETE